jgi:chemotaxis protein methyltransferase CheR
VQPSQTGLAQPAEERLSAQDFNRIRQLAYQRFGLNLSPAKEVLVSSRVLKLLREENIPSFAEYWQRIETDSSGESLIALVNALTTNFTSFMREPKHFEFLRQQVLPTIPPGEPVRIWSAACSSGEEPYSIAMSMLAAGRTPKLVASDISTRAMGKAEKGVYQADETGGVPPDWLGRYFLRGHGNSAGLMKVRPEVHGAVQFRRFNLLSDPLPAERFHVIFCRNVMIYFDAPTKSRVVTRLAQTLLPGGYLFIGHSESLLGVPNPLEYVEPAIYRWMPSSKPSGRGK